MRGCNARVSGMQRVIRIAIVSAAVLLTACGGPKEDQLRTVKSYEFAVCDSTPTTDATQLEAIKAFKSEVQDRYFIRRRDSEFAANHESTADASGVREYEGPFYIYVHPRAADKREVAQGVDWASTVFLHADKVRSRVNGKDWGEWNAVRTRNFSQGGRTVEGLGRWKCLLGAEIAWANVTRANGTWTVTPIGVSVFDTEEIRRALPLPAKTQIEGDEAVEAL